MEAPSVSPAIYTHFVTVTLQPKMYGKSCRQQLRATSKKLLIELNNVCNSYKFVAELTNKCNIHYHGICNFYVTDSFNADILNLMLQDNLKKYGCFGFVDSEAIKDIDKVTAYITKDVDKTYKVVNPRNKTVLSIYWEWAKSAKTDREPLRLRHALATQSKIDRDINPDSEEQLIINSFNCCEKISSLLVYNNAEKPPSPKAVSEDSSLLSKRPIKTKNKIKKKENISSKADSKPSINESITGKKCEYRSNPVCV